MSVRGCRFFPVVPEELRRLIEKGEAEPVSEGRKWKSSRLLILKVKIKKAIGKYFLNLVKLEVYLF